MDDLNDDNDMSEILVGYKMSQDLRTFELIVTADKNTTLNVHNLQTALLSAIDYVAENYVGSDEPKTGLH